MIVLELGSRDASPYGFPVVPHVVFQPEKSRGSFVNLRHESARRGLRYQGFATREIVKSFSEDTVVVDSSFLDHELFRKTYSGCATPDLIAIRAGLLGDLFEFKHFLNPRHNRVDLERKLRGFSLFLQALRENPLLFTDTVELLAGRKIFQPPFSVKDDKDIGVVFASSNPWFPQGEVLVTKGSDLKGAFKAIPFPA